MKAYQITEADIFIARLAYAIDSGDEKLQLALANAYILAYSQKRLQRAWILLGIILVVSAVLAIVCPSNAEFLPAVAGM